MVDGRDPSQELLQEVCMTVQIMEGRAPFPALRPEIPSEKVLGSSVGCRERILLVHQLLDLNTGVVFLFLKWSCTTGRKGGEEAGAVTLGTTGDQKVTGT